jgi:hypothetical protein
MGMNAVFTAKKGCLNIISIPLYSLDPQWAFTLAATNNPAQQTHPSKFIEREVRTWANCMSATYFLHTIEQFLGNDCWLPSWPQLITISNLPVKEFILQKVCDGILAPFVSSASLDTEIGRASCRERVSVIV